MYIIIETAKKKKIPAGNFQRIGQKLTQSLSTDKWAFSENDNLWEVNRIKNPSHCVRKAESKKIQAGAGGSRKEGSDLLGP